jgi:hypothetical protein
MVLPDGDNKLFRHIKHASITFLSKINSVKIYSVTTSYPESSK